MLYQVVKETGWSWHTVLWRISRPNLIMLLADRPQMMREKKAEKVKEVSGKELARALRGS